MIIKVRPEQIPQVWEVIKRAAALSQEIAPEALPGVCQHLLHSLLNESIQCYLTLDENRNVLQVVLTQLFEDLFSGNRTFSVIGLYSFKPIQPQDAREMMDWFIQLAKSQSCDTITGQAKNPRLWALFLSLGTTETSHQFEYKIGGN